MSDNGKVLIQIDNGIGELVFSHPKANSLTKSMLSEITAAIGKLATDERVRVIGVRSEGERTFCAGASFDEFQKIGTPAQGEEFFLGFANLILAIRRSPKFIVCRVQGKAVGGALGLIAACDYSIATEAASGRLSEFELGIGPFTIGPAVERKIGVSAFSSMSIDCDWREASWLADKGLYSKLVKDDVQLEAEYSSLLSKLTTTSSEAMRSLKAVFWSEESASESLLHARAKLSGELLSHGKKSV